MRKYPYIPHTEEDIEEMLKYIGVKSIEDLYAEVPVTITSDLKIPESQDEFSVRRHLEKLASENISLKDLSVFMGAGVYLRYVPSVVHHIAMKPEFLTAYTPYQAEVSQGTLQALFEYQTMICELTGMEVANSSMYDGGSATAEAVLMGLRISRGRKVLVSKAVHPEYRITTKTYVKAQGFEIIEVDFDKETGETSLDDLKSKLDEEIAVVVVQYPNFFGIVEDLEKLRNEIPENVVFVVVTEPVSLALLEPPGKFGADIVVGEGQSLGLYPSFGGPGLGFFATLEKHVRKMPGRIIGETKDVEGKRGYVMILQTREQHIRRAKATSNICSNHAHSALTTAVYMSVMGKEGLKEVAYRSMNTAHYLLKKLEEIGFERRFKGPFFNEFVFKVGGNYEKKWREMVKKKVLGPLPLAKFYKELSDCALACTTEVTSSEDIEKLLEAIR